MLAAITSRVRLGTLVLCAPFRHPALTLKMAVTIDRLSGGRLDLGLGAGWLKAEFDVVEPRDRAPVLLRREIEDPRRYDALVQVGLP